MRSLEQIVADNRLFGFYRSADGKVLCCRCARRGGEAGDARTGMAAPGWSPLTGLVKANFGVDVETMTCDRGGEKLMPEEETR